MTRRLHKLTVLTAVLAVVFTSVIGALGPVVASAAVTDPSGGSSTASFDPSKIQHLDRSTILYNGTYFFDSKIDDNYTYYSQAGGQTKDCTDYINDLTSGNTKATLHTFTQDPTTPGCSTVTQTITITNAFLSTRPFTYQDKNTIITSDTRNIYKYNDSLKEFIEVGGDECKDIIKVSGSDGTNLSVLASVKKGNIAYKDWDAEVAWHGGTAGLNPLTNCFESGPEKYLASRVLLDNPDATASSPGATAGSGSTNNGDTLSLDCKSGLNPLNWLICGIIDGFVKIISWVDNLLNGLLSVGTSGTSGTDPIHIFSTSDPSGAGYFRAWQGFRNIALGLLVIIGLVIIIAQEIGSDFIDAYTVRKTLPRLVVAAVGITLSWQLMRFFVEFANSLGFGVRALIYAPFTVGGNATNQAALGGGGDFAVSLIAGIAGAALGIFGLLSFVATAALAVFVAFVVLILRQIVIILLVMLAPIAIVAYILPNTKKIYDIWWDSFSRALIMFPIISALIAAGRVFSYEANLSASTNSGSVSASIEHIIAYVAYFAPYFLIPYTLKFAGGALARIGAFANNPSRGAFNRLSNFRANQQKKRVTNAGQRAQTAKVFKYAKEGSAGDRVNKRIQQAALIRQARLRPGQFSSSLEGAVSDANYEAGLEAAEKLPGARSFFASDDLMKAGINGGGDYQKTRASLIDSGWTQEQAELGASQAVRLRSQMGAQAFDLAAVAKLPGTGTFAVGENIGQWHELVARVSGGNKSVQASLVAQGKAGFRSAQRYEVSEAGFADHMTAIDMASRKVSTKEITEFLADSAYKSGGAAAVVGVRNDKGAEVFAGAARRMLVKAAQSGDEGEYIRALAYAANIQDQSSGGKKIVTDVLARELFGYDLGGKSVLQRIADVRDRPEFQQARRELGRDLPPEIQGQALQQQQGQGRTPGTPPPPPVGGGIGPAL